MFEEKEPGKPQRWGWTIGIIVVVCILNVSILVVLRVILDSKNEFGEPLVEGEVRQDLTKFLGLFALSFCFGCWCCFCCMGNFFRWITCCFHERTRNSVAHCWSSFVSHQQSAIERIRKKSSATFIMQRRDKIDAQSDERFELKVATIRDRNPYVEFEESDGSNQSSRSSPRQRPLGVEIHREFDRWMEIHRPDMTNSSMYEPRLFHPSLHYEFRRHSVPVGSRQQEHMYNSIGVGNVRYYEIPVSLIAPGTVAV